MAHNFPYRSIPTGWFQVAWSDEVKPKEAKPLAYFGTDLVCYRGEDGTVRVLDAYCGHMGAHLGYGGKVSGGNIQCPFHAWEWTGTGENVCIPYSDQQRGGQRHRMRAWNCVERNQQIYVWHDENGGGPTWELPELAEMNDPEYYSSFSETTRLWAGLTLQPQLITENIVDVAHLVYVHGSPTRCEVDSYEADGPVFRSVLRQGYQTSHGIEHGLSTIASWGVGITYSEMEFGRHRIVSIVSATPIDATTADARSSMFLHRRTGVADANAPLSDVEKRTVDVHLSATEQDFPVWEHLRYNARPPYVPEERKPYQALRSWATQFYPDANDGAQGTAPLTVVGT